MGPINNHHKKMYHFFLYLKPSFKMVMVPIIILNQITRSRNFTKNIK